MSSAHNSQSETASMSPQNSQAAQVQQFNTSSQQKYLPANNNKRVIAYIIDLIIVGVSSQLFVNFVLAPFLAKASGAVYIEFAFNMVLLPMFYWVFLTVQMGATPGKKMLGLKIVRDGDDGHELGLGQLMLRELVGRWVSALPLLLGYLWVCFRKDRRSWHDMISGTRVVEFR